jgi:hypothetical protein
MRPLALIVGLLAIAACSPTAPLVTPGAGGSLGASPLEASPTAESAEPPPSPSRRPATDQPTEEATMSDGEFRLTSTAFDEGGAIPRRHTCDGEDVSPSLEWSGVPDEARSLVLIVDDPDARGFVHWVVYDVTATSTGALPEGFSESPDAPPQGMNDFRRSGYGGPCPPSGTHRYVFTLHALDEPTGLSGTPTAEEVRRGMEGRVVAETRLSATYTRQR